MGMPRHQADAPDFRFASGAPHLRRLDTMVAGVAQQMVQRRFQPFENVAVHRRIAPLEVQPHLLAEGVGDVAREPGKALRAVAKRPHPAGNHFLIKAP